MRVIFLLMALIASFSANSKEPGTLLGEQLIGVKVDAALLILNDYIVDSDSYVELSSCYYLQPKNQNKGPFIMIVNETVARVDFVDHDLLQLTDRDVGIGSSKLEVISAYKNAHVQPHPYLGQAGESIAVTLPSGNGLVFETEFDVVAQYRLGRYPEVEYIEGCL